MLTGILQHVFPVLHKAASAQPGIHIPSRRPDDSLLHLTMGSRPQGTFKTFAALIHVKLGESGAESFLFTRCQGGPEHAGDIFEGVLLLAENQTHIPHKMHIVQKTVIIQKRR